MDLQLVADSFSHSCVALAIHLTIYIHFVPIAHKSQDIQILPILKFIVAVFQCNLIKIKLPFP